MNISTPRLDIGVVGAGTAALALAQALAGVGYRVAALSTTDVTRQERAETAFPNVPILSDAEVIANSQLVLLGIPGNELAQFAAGSAKAGVWRAGQVALHVAPEFGESVLAPLAEQGVIALAVSPAVVLSGSSIDMKLLQGSTVVVSASPAVLPIGCALVYEIDAEPLVIADNDRASYAEARSVAADFSEAIISQAAGILHGIGVDDPAKLLRSVALTSVNRALDKSFRAP